MAKSCTTALSVAPSASWLADLKHEYVGLKGENQELQQLVEEARELYNRAEALKSRGELQKQNGEEDRLVVDSESIRRRAVKCASRPVSAGSSRFRQDSSRPTSATWKKPTSRPVSAKKRSAEPNEWPANANLLTPCSATPAREFVVTVDRSGGENLGMKIRTTNNVLEVTKIKEEGLVAAWNAANPSSAIRKGDRVVQVNDLRGNTEAMYQECMQDCQLRLVLQATPYEYFSVPGTPCAPTAPWCYQQIKALLEQHDKALLASIDQMMEMFQHREVALYETLCKKYGQQPMMPTKSPQEL